MQKAKALVVTLLAALCITLKSSASIRVVQTDYNCIPASIEVVYKLLGKSDIDQHAIRNKLQTKYGAVPIEELEEYLYNNFEYKEKRICCYDSLIAAINENNPVIFVLDGSILRAVNYTGHSVVVTGITKESYIKYIDVDGGYELTAPAERLYKAVKTYNPYAYIIYSIK